MDVNLIYELIGYTGSALVVISMLMTSVVKLRVINLTGSLIFTVYALLIRSYPTAAMNIFLVGINVYHLIRLLKTPKNYDMIRTDVKDAYFDYMLQTSMEDIRQFFPHFSPDEKQADLAYLITCERNPAGLFLASDAGKDELEVLLDYTTPTYRDASAGRYLHDQLKRDGYKTVVFRGDAPKHVDYLENIGYRKNEKGDYVYQIQ